mmetsp:Transcript_10206/g.16318  ORF Transcript_10206/g.16318 Transcript_10206/m.16318 type:complete len:306 (+) Transcript_10206:667-1584(+)
MEGTGGDLGETAGGGDGAAKECEVVEVGSIAVLADGIVGGVAVVVATVSIVSAVEDGGRTGAVGDNDEGSEISVVGGGIAEIDAVGSPDAFDATLGASFNSCDSLPFTRTVPAAADSTTAAAPAAGTLMGTSKLVGARTALTPKPYPLPTVLTRFSNLCVKLGRPQAPLAICFAGATVAGGSSLPRISRKSRPSGPSCANPSETTQAASTVMSSCFPPKHSKPCRLEYSTKGTLAAGSNERSCAASASAFAMFSGGVQCSGSPTRSPMVGDRARSTICKTSRSCRLSRRPSENMRMRSPSLTVAL